MLGRMRDLFQTKPLKAAVLAAALGALACLPRLLLWLGPQTTVWLLAGALFWSNIFLWGFVFAWHEKYSGRRVFQSRVPASLWLLATLCGIAGAVILHIFPDPVLRSLTPQDYPKDLKAWVAMTLFALALDQVFLCFASFAFFIRLSRSVAFSKCGTITLALLVLGLKLATSPAPPPGVIIAALVVIRLVGTWLSLHFYLRGGAWLAWWWIFVMQLRLLFVL